VLRGCINIVLRKKLFDRLSFVLKSENAASSCDLPGFDSPGDSSGPEQQE
jgi:hypothetical protein